MYQIHVRPVFNVLYNARLHETKHELYEGGIS